MVDKARNRLVGKSIHFNHLRSKAAGKKNIGDFFLSEISFLITTKRIRSLDIANANIDYFFLTLIQRCLFTFLIDFTFELKYNLSVML